MIDRIADLLRNRIQPGGADDLFWGRVTIALSILVVLGYGLIALKWFFQFKLAERKAARAALARMRLIVGCCVVLCIVFVSFNLTHFTWMWRVYDLMLLLLATYTWVFAVQMRGVRLADERLAKLSQLEESVARYRQLADRLPLMIWTADGEGRIDYSNHSWAEYAGQDRSWLEALDEREAQQVRSAWQEAVRSREPFQREVRLAGIKERRTYFVRAVPIHHGQEVRWLGACADVEELRQQAARQETQARQNVFFLNALSHDLRAPLNSIALNANLLERTTRAQEELETIRAIAENALSAGQLLATLLEYARAGHEARVVERVAVGAVLQQIRRRFAPVAEQRGLTLQVEGRDDLACHTDRHKLERIISNLVDNAVKYTHRGGVEVSARLERERLVVTVADTGGGVPRDSAPLLFDEFYQVDNPGRERGKGFGLGLAICKTLARQLGGEVRLARTGPDGSCFEVTVRDERPPAAAPPTEKISPGVQLARGV